MATTKPEPTASVIARISLEARHARILLEGGSLPPEVKKKYHRLCVLAEQRAEYDAANK